MNTGANIADFGEEFGKHASIATGRGSDNSEEAANKALHKNFDFSKPNVTSEGSVGYGESTNKDDVKYHNGQGARWTDKAYNSPNEAGK